MRWLIRLHQPVRSVTPSLRPATFHQRRDATEAMDRIIVRTVSGTKLDAAVAQAVVASRSTTTTQRAGGGGACWYGAPAPRSPSRTSWNR